MSIEHREPVKFSAPTYEIDISEGWDTESQIAAFIKGLKKLKIYRKGLLYSGFDGSKVGQQFHSNEGEDVIFCSHEENLTGSYSENTAHADNQSAFDFASEYKQPAIAIYDPSKMEKGLSYHEYKIKDPAALLAIIILK